MNRSRIALAALSFGAASILGPAIASADPWIAAESSGAPISTGGTSGTVGQEVIISGSGCNAVGGATYMGEFVALAGDPLSNDNSLVYETQTDGAGSFEWHVTIPLDTAIGTYTARWYCASAPVSSIDDPAMLWVSPPMWMQIDAAAPLGAKQATSRHAVRSGLIRSMASGTAGRAASAPAPAPSTVSMTVDPDALPVLDKMGITGPKAAALKAKVDERVATGTKLSHAVSFLLGRRAAAAPASNADYVTAAFQVAGVKNPSAKEAEPFVARLDAGELRVAVIEDIALTQHDAGWWNQR